MSAGKVVLGGLSRYKKMAMSGVRIAGTCVSGRETLIVPKHPLVTHYARRVIRAYHAAYGVQPTRYEKHPGASTGSKALLGATRLIDAGHLLQRVIHGFAMLPRQANHFVSAG